MKRFPFSAKDRPALGIPVAAALLIAALTPAYAANAIPSEDRPTSAQESRGLPDDQALRIEYLDNGCHIIER